MIPLQLAISLGMLHGRFRPVRLLSLAVTLWCLAAPPHAADFGKWSSVVPAGGQAKAEVMVLTAPPDIDDISMRVQQAAQRNPEWFRNYAATVEPGKPLPYHENMGITAEEYRRLLTGANELVLSKAGEIEIVFSVSESGVVALRGLPMSPPDHQLLYVPAEDLVRTAHGVLTDVIAIDQNDPQSPTGRWQGLQWKLEDFSSKSDFAIVKLAMGQLKDRKINLIYYDVNIAKDGEHDQYNYILLYDAD